MESLSKAFVAMTLAFAALLEREAGYFLVSLSLIVVGVCLADQAARAQLAHDLVVFGTGVLARSMTGKGKPDVTS